MAELDLELGVSIQTLSSEVRKMREDQHRKWADRFTDQKLNASATVDASGYAVLKFPECPAGRRWFVRRLVVGGTTWSSVVSGAAVIVVTSGGVPMDAGPPLSEIVDVAPSLPNIAFYGHHEIVIKASQQLFVVINGGGTTGQALTASLQIVDEPE